MEDRDRDRDRNPGEGIEGADVDAPTLLESAWGGARLVARVGSFFLLPVALVLSAVGLVLTWFGLGAGYGFAVHDLALRPWAVFLVVMAAGVVVGALTGLGRWLARRRGKGSIWDRPIRLVPRRPRRDRDEGGAGRASGPSTPIPWARPRRSWGLWFGLPTLVVSAAGLVAGLVAGPSVRGRLDRAIAEAERLDPRWRLDEILADRIPDELPEETSSSVVAEVYAGLPEGWFHQKPLPPPEDGTASPPDSPLRLATDRVLSLKPAVPIDPVDLATIAEALAEYHDLVDRALALADLGEGYHELVPTLNPMEMMLPETQNSRSVAHLLLLEAAVDASEGRADEAIDDARAILGVARSIGDEPTMISAMARVAMDRTAIVAAGRALGEAEPSAEALERLQSDLIAARGVGWLVRGLKGERASLDALIRRLRDGELSINDFTRDGNPRMKFAGWYRLALDNQRAMALEWGNRMVALGSQPYPEQTRLARELENELRAEKAKRTFEFTSLLPVLLMPALPPALSAQNRIEADLGALVVLVAAERHRQAHGDWPASASTIDPAILPDPPLDPFTGKPYVMERLGGRLLVHSVGFNGVDEHGAVDDKKWQSGGADDFGSSVPEAPRP